MMNDEDVPIPDVGAPPFTGDDGADEAFFGSFSGGGVYHSTEDPSPSFHYISPALIAPEDNILDILDTAPVHEVMQMPNPLDSFEDIPLDEYFVEKTESDFTSPPPMLFGMAISVTTTVTVVEEVEVSAEGSLEVENGQQVAVAIKVRSLPPFPTSSLTASTEAKPLWTCQVLAREGCVGDRPTPSLRQVPLKRVCCPSVLGAADTPTSQPTKKMIKTRTESTTPFLENQQLPGSLRRSLRPQTNNQIKKPYLHLAK